MEKNGQVKLLGLDDRISGIELEWFFVPSIYLDFEVTYVQFPWPSSFIPCLVDLYDDLQRSEITKFFRETSSPGPVF